MSGDRNNNWRQVQLGSLAEFRNGINFSKENFGRGIKVIGVSDFQSNVRATFDQLDEINPEGVVRKEHLLRNGDILFVRSNGNRELIGRSMYVDDVPGEVTHSAFSIRLRFTSPECNPRFYSYLFRSQLIRKVLSLYGGGTNISNLNQDILGRLQVPVPPLVTQRHIAEVLAAYDDLIENNSRRIAVLEEMTHLIYREWFVNFRFPGRENDSTKETSLGSIPVGWEVKSLDRLMDFQGGAQPPKVEWSSEPRDGYVRMIQIRDYESDSYLCFVKESKNLRKCNKYDIMIARYGASVARICSGLEGAYNVALVRVVPQMEEYREFLRSYLESDNFQHLLIGMSGRTAQAGFNKTVLKSIQVAVPKDLVLITQFQNICVPLRKLIQSLREASKRLVQTRDFLLPKLTSGEVSIEQFQTEAASQTV